MAIRTYKVTLDQLKAKVDAGYLTAKQFYEITGQEYDKKEEQRCHQNIYFQATQSAIGSDY